MAQNLQSKSGLVLPSEPEYTRHASGYILKDGEEVACTMQCVHGGEHFIWVKGSGRTRGYCLRCGGITCGSPMHSPCMDWRLKMELYEQGQGVLR